MKTNHTSSATLDTTLASLCARCPYLADEVLDFRGCIQSRSKPGQCVRALFGLLGEARRCNCPEVGELESWSRDAIEIAVLSVPDNELERMPFQPGEHDDLTSYCYAAMRTVSQDRVYSQPSLRLRFEYRA